MLLWKCSATICILQLSFRDVQEPHESCEYCDTWGLDRRAESVQWASECEQLSSYLLSTPLKTCTAADSAQHAIPRWTPAMQGAWAVTGGGHKWSKEDSKRIQVLNPTVTVCCCQSQVPAVIAWSHRADERTQRDKPRGLNSVAAVKINLFSSAFFTGNITKVLYRVWYHYSNMEQK